MSNAVSLPSWAPGKSGFPQAQQVGVDSARGREPVYGKVGRSEGRSAPSRRAAPRTRRGYARRPDPLSGRVPGRPRAVGRVEGVGIAFHVEDHFQSFPPRKERVCGGSICLVWGNSSYPTLAQHSSFQVIIKSLETLKSVLWCLLITVMYPSGKLRFSELSSQIIVVKWFGFFH